MRIHDTGDLWWKNAVIYCLDVETFMDWNDDGIGDLPGLVQRIDTWPTSASRACGSRRSTRRRTTTTATTSPTSTGSTLASATRATWSR